MCSIPTVSTLIRHANHCRCAVLLSELAPQADPLRASNRPHRGTVSWGFKRQGTEHEQQQQQQQQKRQASDKRGPGHLFSSKQRSAAAKPGAKPSILDVMESLDEALMPPPVQGQDLVAEPVAWEGSVVSAAASSDDAGGNLPVAATPSLAVASELSGSGDTAHLTFDGSRDQMDKAVKGPTGHGLGGLSVPALEIARQKGIRVSQVRFSDGVR
jgi:hypothetical protein